MSLFTILCYIVATMYLFYQYLSIVRQCGGLLQLQLQLLERQVYSVARLCPDQTFLSLCHRRHVAALCMLFNVCLFVVCSLSFHLLL